MKQPRLQKRYLMIPFLYAAVVLFLFYLHLTDITPFQYRHEALVLSGESSVFRNGSIRTVKSLELELSGLSIAFDRKTRLELETKDGMKHRLGPIGYEALEGGFRVRFRSDIALDFLYRNETLSRLEIKIDAPDPEALERIFLPLEVAPGAELTREEGIPVITYRRHAEEAPFFLVLKEGVTYRPSAGRLEIETAGGPLPELVLEESPDKRGDAFAYWFSRNTEMADQGDYRQARAAYLEKARSGWTTGRFKPGQGVWSLKGGRDQYSEEIVTALLSSSLNSPEYSRILYNVTRASRRYPEGRDLLSAPLLGGILKGYREALGREEPLLKELRVYAEIGNPDLFLNKNLGPLYLKYPDEAWSRHIQALAADVADFTLEQQLGLFSFYQYLRQNLAASGDLFPSLRDFPSRYLLPRIKVLDEGLFVADLQDRLDMKATVRTAALLLTEGAYREDELYSSLCYELMGSLFRLSDSRGYLPRFLLAGDDGLVSDGILPPEGVYPLLPDLEYYPSWHYFQTAGGRSLRVFTAAEALDFEETPDGYLFSGRFPSGSTHYLLFEGVPRLAFVQLFGVSWNPFSRFESYPSGWFQEGAGACFVKIEHKREREKILLIPPREDSDGS